MYASIRAASIRGRALVVNLMRISKGVSWLQKEVILVHTVRWLFRGRAALQDARQLAIVSCYHIVELTVYVPVLLRTDRLVKLAKTAKAAVVFLLAYGRFCPVKAFSGLVGREERFFGIIVLIQGTSAASLGIWRHRVVSIMLRVRIMLDKVRLRPLAINAEEVLVVAAILLMSKRKWISAVATA